MIQEALKFTDLQAFFSEAGRQGFNGEIKSLLFEQGQAPYGSAYFIPTRKLPESFDLTGIDEFGGQLTCVETFRYLGTERFTADFMVLQQSLTGYIEISDPDPVICDHNAINWATLEMTHLIILEDGGGKEFFLNVDGKFVPIEDTAQEPHTFKSYKQAVKKADSLRPQYAANCSVYTLEQRELDIRRSQTPNDKD